MDCKHTALVVVFAALLFSPNNACAIGEHTIAKIPDGATITIDGKLTEAVWANAFANQTFKLAPSITAQVVSDTKNVFDDDNDARVEFTLLWNKNIGFYFGGKFYDDIHQASVSTIPDSGAYGYKDDSFQFWVSGDYYASYNGDRTYELSFVLGFGSPNDPDKQYSGYWGWDPYSGRGYITGNWTPAEAKQMGWEYQYTSDDGINFEIEALWMWSSIFMNYRGSGDIGDVYGFDLCLRDNDGGTSWEGGLWWGELHHQKGTNPELHWVKIVLGSPLSILPVTQYSLKLSSHSGNTIAHYDIFGKKIQPYQLPTHKGIRIEFPKNGRAVKRVVLK